MPVYGIALSGAAIEVQVKCGEVLASAAAARPFGSAISCWCSLQQGQIAAANARQWVAGSSLFCRLAVQFDSSDTGWPSYRPDRCPGNLRPILTFFDCCKQLKGECTSREWHLRRLQVPTQAGHR